LVIAGGGTGGHVQPAVAVYQRLRASTAVEALWLGSHRGVEQSAADRSEIVFTPIQTGKFRRYLSLRTPVDLVRIPIGVLQAYRTLKRFRPDVVLSTGGFVSVPTIVASRLLHIPSLTHEQTATVGLATRINARFATVVALSFEQSRAQLRGARARITVTGNPIRAALFNGAAGDGLNRFGLSPEMPLVYVTGGALGAHAINQVIQAALPDLLTVTQVVHQCGAAGGNGDYPRLLAARAALPEVLQPRYVVREQIGDELPDLYAAASLVVGRAGAGTVAELAALGKPSILIPLPGTGGDEQTVNAHVLAGAGGAVLLPQSELTAQRLVTEIRSLLGSDRLSEMSKAALSCGQRDADERLAAEILALAKKTEQ
jgi:UDP-N-acetylglucosamine--N-acetylmuramyl-(pentapeptide) pyrophosphoryl-undecaprenol N-acetylglucosamine transferase